MGYGYCRLLEFEYREMKRSCFFGQRDLEMIVYPEAGTQVMINMPAQLVIPYRRCNTDQERTFEEVFH